VVRSFHIIGFAILLWVKYVSAELMKMMEANRKMWDRQGYVLDGCKKVGEMRKGVLTGENSLVDLKESEIEVEYNADFKADLKSAREIVGEMKNIKKSADYNGYPNTSEACQRIIKKYMPEGLEEMVAGE
jgi:hypothetical protein